MFSLGSTHRYYLYKDFCNMRKSFDGLCGLVRNELGREPSNGDVYVFINKRKPHLKLLHWQSGGFVLYYKRLSEGQFVLPSSGLGSGYLSWSELVLLVEGLWVRKLKAEPRYVIPSV